ncbi:unnamed protein product [Acanthoscelides obtectus]|uniref:Uncharacterized protein n=1 Tax=Acanthoscelides obtectus TaxID=200917 RepID=A0A9P0PXU8_ACAOB|nr:unnamed protein product [Acanthoscelides obtectus]CAH2002543.1 unnamed protein product [Acanthoscelides obtectus]CAK1630242.1 hypothetical protein AOBTE_LOCUS6222 [Acanthoscelides obtectus]CAK1630251.1 hypothetical protein AOBTE_LOCUS6228 [Acanthoscelides obtectus]
MVGSRLLRRSVAPSKYPRSRVPSTVATERATRQQPTSRHSACHSSVSPSKQEKNTPPPWTRSRRRCKR